jgi:hypothetical protein
VHGLLAQAHMVHDEHDEKFHSLDKQVSQSLNFPFSSCKIYVLGRNSLFLWLSYARRLLIMLVGVCDS